jgi:hypothetical protein
MSGSVEGATPYNPLAGGWENRPPFILRNEGKFRYFLEIYKMLYVQNALSAVYIMGAK